MRYINLRLTYLLTFLSPNRLSIEGIRAAICYLSSVNVSWTM